VLTAELRQRLVHEVLSGLAYLHELSIVHRDVKTANVLLDGDLHAAVCDFSIATRFGMEHTSCVGTLRYMAPEVCFGPYDSKADVFAYAMLLWETLHIAVPFAASDGLKAILWTCEGQRPPIQLAPPLDRYEKLINRCWHQSPEMRPSMAKTLALLEGLMAGAPGTPMGTRC
jgi:serine/threonine protein kinase